MSITFISTTYIGEDENLFRPDNYELMQIEENSELYEYLYDENKHRLRTEDDDANIYKLKKVPIYAIKCIDKFSYPRYDKPHYQHGKSELISIITKFLLSLFNKGEFNVINLILHFKDIDSKAFDLRSYSEMKDFTQKGCVWVSPENVKKFFLTVDVIRKIEEYDCVINVAFFTHGRGVFNDLLFSDTLSSSDIDSIFSNVKYTK